MIHGSGHTPRPVAAEPVLPPFARLPTGLRFAIFADEDDRSLAERPTAVLTICAAVVTGLLVRREFAGPAETARPAIRETVRDWQAYGDGRHRVGLEEAVVTIVEFSDFQCPFCRVAAGKLDSLRDEYPRDVAVVYRHFPVPQHRHAVAAAQASECAGAQGRSGRCTTLSTRGRIPSG
jgi:hypothetical protein